MADKDAVPASVSRELEATVLALNNAHAEELSLLDAAKLRALLGEAFYARQIGGGAAFLMAFDEDAAYDSPNYLWFRERYQRFVYIDRIVVESAARGRGYARCLYADLIGRAAEAGHDIVVCEVNSDPPNPASDAFHAALGFARIGMASIHGGSKMVSYLALPINRMRQRDS